MDFFKNPNIDFMRWRWPALALSAAVIVAGLVVILTKGIPLGIEFAGGTTIIAEFEQTPSVEAVRGALDQTFSGGEVVVQTYGDAAERQILIRVPQVGEEEGASLSKAAEDATAALKQGGLGSFTVIGTEIVGPAVGRDLTTKGIYAFVASLLGILAYIAFRFRLSFAIGAVAATIHDLLVTLAFLAFFQYELSLNVIAAILTVAGYSTNDTIVIFDRVRENARSQRRESVLTVINTALNQTLSRTVITAGVTLLSVIALFLFGGEVLRGFAFAMIVGIISGTYSTIFVAAAVVSLWQNIGKRSSASAGTESATATEARPAAKRQKSNRKARAS